MHRRARLVVPSLVLLVLTAGLLAACGGGGEQSGGGNPQNGDGGGGQQGGPREQARETKIAIGSVVSVKPDRRRMVMRASRQAEGGDERLIFKIRKNAEIMLGNQEAEVGEVTQGQQAQVEYVVRNDMNRATSIQLFEADQQGQQDQPSGGEGTSN